MNDNISYKPYEEKKVNSFGSTFRNLFKKSDDQSTETSSQETSVSWTNSIGDSLTQKMNDTQEQVETYKVGVCLLIIGFIIICFSMIYLPFIVIMPQKFNSLYMFGSVIIMVALAQMMGTKKFCKAMYTKKNIFYSFVYTASLVTGLYSSANHISYIVSLSAAICNIISLSYLLFANLPYGKRILDAIWGGCYKGFKGCCKCMFSK